MLDLTVADALNLTWQHRLWWFVQAHSRLQIFHVMMGSSPRLGMAPMGQFWSLRWMGNFLNPCKISCGCAL